MPADPRYHSGTSAVPTAARIHEPDGDSWYDTERGGWVRRCSCGSLFISFEDWRHVPALFDHIATGGRKLGIV